MVRLCSITAMFYLVQLINKSLYGQLCAYFVKAHELAYNRIYGKTGGRMNLEFGCDVSTMCHDRVYRYMHFCCNFLVAQPFYYAHYNFFLTLAQNLSILGIRRIATEF